jgi:hypothetical protein
MLLTLWLLTRGRSLFLKFSNITSTVVSLLWWRLTSHITYRLTVKCPAQKLKVHSVEGGIDIRQIQCHLNYVYEKGCGGAPGNL